MDPRLLFDPAFQAKLQERLRRKQAREEPRPCKGCGKVLKMRSNQDYCNPACRNAFVYRERSRTNCKKPVRLNDLTREEIAALSPGDYKHCRFCGKRFFARPAQIFCSLSCKNAFTGVAVVTLQEQFAQARELWETEREELVREITELKRKLTEWEGE